MKKLNCLFILFFLISSCCKEVPFNPKDSFWYSIYSINDSIIFLSNNHDFDTLVISDVIIKEPEGKCNLLVSSYERAFARIDYKINKDTFSTDQNYLVQFRQEPEGMESVPVIRVFNMEFHQDLQNNKSLIKEKYFLKSKNELLSDCFLFNDQNCELRYGQSFGMVEFIWSKDLGLVLYKNEKGETWEYYKIIKAPS